MKDTIYEKIRGMEIFKLITPDVYEYYFTLYGESIFVITVG